MCGFHKLNSNINPTNESELDQNEEKKNDNLLGESVSSISSIGT